MIEPSRISGREKDARIYCWSFLPRFELRRMALDRIRDLNFENDHDGVAGEPRRESGG